MNQRLEYMALEKESQGSGSSQIFVEKKLCFVCGRTACVTNQTVDQHSCDEWSGQESPFAS